MPTVEEIDRAAARRARVLELIGEAISTKGYPPTVSELAAATEVTTRTTRADLIVLVEAGKIERDARTYRGIRLVPQL